MQNDLPARSITRGDVRGVHESEVHGGGILVLSETLKSDNLPGVWSGNHHRIHDGKLPLHAQDLSCNRLELAASQPDSTPTPGVGRELLADNKVVPLPLPWMPGILLYVERRGIPLQQASLKG